MPLCVKSAAVQLLDKRFSKFDCSRRFGGLDDHAGLDRFYFPFHLPLSRISIIPPGLVVVMWPNLSASAISSANISASVEEALYHMLAPALWLKLASVAPISRFCWSPNDLQPTAASIFARAKRSSSASFFSCAVVLKSSAASFSVWAARSNAALARSFANAVRVWDSCSNISSNVCTYPSALDTKLSATYSPATPTTMSNQPTAAKSFAQLGAGSSGREKRNLRLNLQWWTIEVMSCHNSGPSRTRPATTSPVAASNQLKHDPLYASSPACMRSSIPLSVSGLGIGMGGIDGEDERTEAMIAHIWFVAVAAIMGNTTFFPGTFDPPALIQRS